MLPDESFQSYFLDVFGRPQRISACECERVSEANLAQALHLLNSDEIQNKLARAGGRADMLAKDKRPDAEKVEEMFLWAFARKPTRGAAATGPGPHRQARQGQEGRLREHPVGADQHQGVHVQPVNRGADIPVCLKLADRNVCPTSPAAGKVFPNLAGGVFIPVHLMAFPGMTASSCPISGSPNAFFPLQFRRLARRRVKLGVPQQKEGPGQERSRGGIGPG